MPESLRCPLGYRVDELPDQIICDFNGHIGGLGEQREDTNGRMIKEWMSHKEMILVNIDGKCEGEITWQRNEMKSTIDFVVVNEKMYELIIGMKIDEKKELFELSDHNMIEIRLNVGIKEKRKNDSWIERKYYTTEEEPLKMFKGKVENIKREGKVDDMADYNRTIRNAADDILERIYKRKERVDADNKVMKERPWFTEEIRKEIKIRKNLNKESRKEQNEEKKRRKFDKYHLQKRKVQKLVREAIRKYEIRITKEIKMDKDRKKLWLNIRKLQGKESKSTETYIYDKDKKKMEQKEERLCFEETWKKIYGKHPNNISEVWNDQERNTYEEIFKKDVTDLDEDEQVKFNPVLREHMDMAFEVKKNIKAMELRNIMKGEVVEVIKKMKKNKAPGKDGIKAEMMKILEKSEICMDKMTECLNKVLMSGDVPEEWKRSKTRMIKKTNKPTAEDFRPIALTGNTYKIFMTIIKERLESHLNINDEQRELTVRIHYRKKRRRQHVHPKVLRGRNIQKEESVSCCLHRFSEGL